MTFFVDTLLPCPTSTKWRWHKSCHLFTHPGEDAVEALIAFAGRLGLRRSWLQRSRGNMPHFDLTLNKRRLALRLGAVSVNGEGMVEVLNEWRSAGRSG